MKYIVPVLSVLVLIAGALAPQLQGLVASHPSLSIIFAALGSILAAFAPQPHK
jgi:hypothetical protein